MKRKTVISLLPILLHIIIAQLSGAKISTTFIFGIIIFVFGYFLKSKKELVISIIAYFSIAFLINMLEGNDLIRFFFLIKVFFLIAIISGYYSKNNKYTFIIFPILFSLFMFFGYNDYLSFIVGRNSTRVKKQPQIALFDSNLNEITLNEKDKIYVLDFWSTSCGVCIKKFPDFEKTVLKYKNNSNLVFYSVNIPVRKENIDDNITLTHNKYNYKFNKLFAKDFSPCDSLGFNKFL